MRYVTALFTAVLAFIVVTFAYVGTAAAADLPADASWIDLAKPVLDAAVSGSPALALACALVAAVALARKYGGSPADHPRWPWIMTDVGGTALTFLGSLGAAFAAALTGGALPSLGLLWTALVVAAGASGGYTAIKRLAVPVLRFLESKLPAKLKPWVGWAFDAALYLFENRGQTKAAKIAKAEQAGAAAVQAKPAEGAAKVVKVGKSFP